MELVELRMIKDVNEDRFSNDYLLYFGLSGDVIITSPDTTAFTLKKNDVIVFNPKERHYIDARKGVCLQIIINDAKMKKLTDSDRKMILCNTCENKNDNSDKLVRIIRELIKSRMESAYDKLLYQQNSLQLVFFLMTRYSNNIFTEYNERISERIEDYLTANYTEPITLENAAEYFGFTPQYFSKYFRKTMGNTFLKCLNQLRAEHAAEDLINTDTAVLKVAIDNGFPNTASFIRVFREQYGVSPSEYRRNNQKKILESGLQNSEISLYLSETDNEQMQQIHEIDIDAANRSNIVLNPYWTNILNLGSFQTVMKTGMFDQILMLQNSFHFRYARLKADILSEKGKNNYYIAYRVMDFFVENHMDVIITLDMRDVGSRQDYLRSFRELCLNYRNKYGEGISKHTVFEIVFNTQFNSEKILSYKDFYFSIKAVLEELNYNSNIMGPGVLIDESGENFREFINAGMGIKTYTISTAPFSIQKKNGEVFINRMTDADYVMEQYRVAERVLKETQQDAKLLITEWKDSLNDVDILNDTEYMGARIIRNILRGYGVFSSLPMSVPLDLLMDETVYSNVFNGLPGIITNRGIRKPSYYAYRFLAQHDLYLTEITSDYLISESADKGYYQIACHNCKRLGFRYYVHDVLNDTDEDLSELFDDTEPVQFVFRFHNMPKGEYLLKIRSVSQQNGAAYYKYRDLRYGEDTFISRDETEFIKSSSFPEMKGESYSVGDDEELVITQSLTMNEFRHIHLIKKR